MLLSSLFSRDQNNANFRGMSQETVYPLPIYGTTTSLRYWHSVNRRAHTDVPELKRREDKEREATTVQDGSRAVGSLMNNLDYRWTVDW